MTLSIDDIEKTYRIRSIIVSRYFTRTSKKLKSIEIECNPFTNINTYNVQLLDTSRDVGEQLEFIQPCASLQEAVEVFNKI